MSKKQTLEDLIKLLKSELNGKDWEYTQIQKLADGRFIIHLKVAQK